MRDKKTQAFFESLPQDTKAELLSEMIQDETLLMSLDAHDLGHLIAEISQFSHISFIKDGKQLEFRNYEVEKSRLTNLEMVVVEMTGAGEEEEEGELIVDHFFYAFGRFVGESENMKLKFSMISDVAHPVPTFPINQRINFGNEFKAEIENASEEHYQTIFKIINPSDFLIVNTVYHYIERPDNASPWFPFFVILPEKEGLIIEFEDDNGHTQKFKPIAYENATVAGFNFTIN